MTLKEKVVEAVARDYRKHLEKSFEEASDSALDDIRNMNPEELLDAISLALGEL